MKRIVKQALVLVFALVSLQSQFVSAKKCNDLLLIFDPNLNEGVDGKSMAMVDQFIDGLYEKAAPMIVSSNLVENFCFWKTAYKQIFEDIKQELIKTKNVGSARQKTKDLFSQIAEVKEFAENPSAGSFIAGADLSGNDWDCYVHKQSDLVLLIPKNYIARRAPQIMSGPKAQAEACGFKVADLNKIENVSSESVLSYIQSKKTVSSINIINAVKSMIVVEKPLDNSKLSSWNFYISGHGGPAKKKKMLMQEQANRIEWRDEAQPFVEEYRAKGDDARLNRTIQYIAKMQKNIDAHLPLLKSIENFSDETIVPQSACVAGISFDDFAQLMRFFNTDIETNYVHYATCFGGGYNQTFINDVLQKLKVNFIVTAEGSGEVSTIGERAIVKPNASDSQLVLEHMMYTSFFGLLENFFGETTKVVGMEVPQGWQKNPIAAIVGSVVNLSKIGINQPSVRIPAVGVFTALDVDKRVKILTNTIVKAHELEGHVIDIALGIDNLIVYPAYVGIPIKMQTARNIVSPMPQKIEHLYRTTHIFEEIISEDRLYDIIQGFIKLNSSYSKITFIIKKLTCDGFASGLGVAGKPLILENVVIQIVGDLSAEQVIDATINFAFTFDGNAYSFSKFIKNIAEQRVQLNILFQDLSSLLSDREQLKDLAVKMLDPNDIKELEGRPMTVAAIADQFDKKLDKSLRVQKPGALKKILLMQKLKSLEDATMPEAFLAQKDWLEKNKKPAAQFTKSLNRYEDNLEELQWEWDNLGAGVMNAQENSAVQERIKNVRARISSTR